MQSKSLSQRLFSFLRRSPAPQHFSAPHLLSAVRAAVDDSPGWGRITPRPHERDLADLQQLYADALTAWRVNPIAWRIIAITTDYVVGDQLSLSSPQRRLERFIQDFWNHPQNRLDLRLEPMCDELARAGDLFVLLFRNPADGMSYLRLATKDRITRIETAPNDWELELSYEERTPEGETRRWLSPAHPEAQAQGAVMLHYAVNRPAGALLGESDLATMLPWLLRYSRMLEDRVRLHWAVRSFLWAVTVPSNRVMEKQEQYRTPPEAGSIIVKDESEQWQAVAPNLHGADAQHDLKAVRGMIDAGSGYPPHWRGEAADANLATATAMQAPTERHLRRRQLYFSFILQDIVYQAYQRQVEAGLARPLPTTDYRQLFTLEVPEVSRDDNLSLAQAAHQIAQAFHSLGEQMPARSSRLARLAASLVLRFAGAPQPDSTLDALVEEGFSGNE